MRTCYLLVWLNRLNKMPYYAFCKDDEYHEVFFHMNDDKSYNGPEGDEEGLWKRVWTVPQMSIATRIDPFSKKDWNAATQNKNYSLGDMWDKSAEISSERAEKAGGEDPVKREYFDDYAKKRKGQTHPQDHKSGFETKDVKVEF